MTLFNGRKELRLSFLIDEDGNVRQYVNPDLRMNVLRKKMSEKECLEYAYNDFTRPFDILGKECLFRCEIIETETVPYVLTDIHHLICDGMTFTPIITTMDFPVAYAGEPLRDIPYGMLDAAEDEQSQIGGEAYLRDKQYYTEKFQGMNFATLSSESGDKIGRMIRESSFLPVAKVDEWCKANGVACNLLFQAAFSYVLSVFLRQDTIAYTSVNHGRMDRRLRTSYGMFVRTVPILSRIEKGMSVRDYIMSFRMELMSTIRHGFYPFNHLCQDLGMTPGISFNFQALPDMKEYLQIEDRQYPAVQPERGEETNDMSAMIFFTGENYEIRMESSDALNSHETMRTLANAMKNALLDMMGKIDAPVNSVSILDEEEYHHVMKMSEGKHIDIDFTKTFVSAFVDCAKKYADAPAVVDAWGQFTYAELDRNSNILSHILIDNGVEPNSFVCLMLDRTKEFPLSVLAIQKSGAAYTPLDLEYPNERLSYMIENSQSKVLVTTHDVFAAKQAESNFVVGDVHVVYLNDIDFNDANLLAEPINMATPQNLAYMIYTSGSTGTPKGAMLHHKGLWNFINFIADFEQLTDEDSIVGHRSFSFDAHIEDMYPILTIGGSFHIMPSSIRKDLNAMYDFIVEHKITGGGYTTQIAALLLNTFVDLPVRFITAGGEKLAGVYSNHVEIINVYGPTECTCDTTYYSIKPGERIEDIPIGKTAHNNWNFIVGPSGQLLPPGVPGELCFAGVQVGYGYWQLPDRTAKAFCDCPFVSKDAWGQDVRMYHTGDLCRFNENGDIIYMGRIDFQVKLRGFRIELGEIESKTLSIDGIGQAVAEVKKVNSIDHLLLYYTLEEGCSLSETDIRKSLEESSLANYMVPDTYVEMETMPLTPNGKVNRRALPIPEIKSLIEYVEPANDTERVIAETIKEVLGLATEVGAMDNFFSLGGDSIKSIRLVSLVRQKGLTLSVADVMKGKTVRAIAEMAKQGEMIDISQEAIEGEVPQGAIIRYFFNLHLPHAEHYNQSVAFECGQRIDTTALHASLCALTTHHDMLRMKTDNVSLYINDKSAKLYDFMEKDVDTIAEVTAESDAMQRQINLADGPVLKVALFHTLEKDIVVMICHHLAVDGVSWRIIAEDLNNGYRMASEGREITLPQKTHSYKYYAEAIARYRDSYALSREKAYWTKIQKKMEALPQGGNNGMPGQMQKLHTVYTNNVVRHLLTDAHAAYNTNENDLLVAALLRSYCKQTGNNSASVLMEGHGREPIHEPLVTDRTVGWFTSMYPIVVEGINGDVRHDLRAVKESFRSVPNKGLGYGILQYVPSAEGDANLRTDLKEILGLNYLGELTEESTDSVLTINTQIPTGSMVNADGVTGPSFMLDCSVAGDSMNIEATYDSKVWNAAQADEMLKSFCDELETIVGHTTAVSTPEPTASDLGATDWTDEQYEKIASEFASRGECIERIYPLTPMQEGILLENMMNPDTASYVLLDRFSMEILPTKEQMQYVVDRLAAKHEVFRTSVIFNGIDNPCQAIVDRKPVVKYVDISAEADIMAASQHIHDEELHNGFHLQKDSLLRVVVMKTSEHSCHILFCTHHIIVDGWCLAIYLADFFRLLSEAMEGVTTSMPTYDDAGRYEKAIRDMFALDKKASMKYWKNLVGDYYDKAIVPYSNDGNTTENSGEVQKVIMSPELQDKLKSVASAFGVTMNTIMELVWGLVLQTYNRTEDVIFGKVVSGRNRGDVADLVGLFINTVPVRVRSDKDTTISQALQTLQQQASETAQHDYCALSEIQQLSNLGSGLFQSRITFENYEGSDTLWNMTQNAGIKVIQTDEINFSELHVTVANGEAGELLVQFVYDGRLYSSNTISHVKNLFFHLLDEISENADRKVCELPLLSDEEQAAVVGMRITAQIDIPWKLYHQPIEENAIKYADRTAIIAKDRTLTFAEFNTEANRVAHALMRKGVKRGDRVVLLLPRRSGAIVSMYGVTKAGAAYIPCDPEYPADRINLIMTDSEAQYVVTTPEHAPDYPAEKVILIDEIYNTGNTLPEDDLNPNVKVSPEDLAYLIYTSGSTGRPKGVMLRHVGIANYVYPHPANVFFWSLKEMDVKVYVSITTLSFDMSLKEFAGSLANGITCVLADEQEVLDAQLLADLMDRTGAEVINGTCSRILSYMELPAFGKALSHCKVVCSGGEQYSMQLLSLLQKMGIRIFNTYGPTEITVSSNGAELTTAKKITVGRPLLNYKEFIVDKYDREVPVGIIGELLIGGSGVACGYNNLPEMTAEHFVEYQGVRVYRSGDLARWMPNGEVEILGRIDSQIKLRGFRIELGEIEAVASRFSGIKQAVVDVRAVGALQHLCLYYTADKEIDQDALKTFMSESLTDYMVPSAYMLLDEIPLTPNGKTNRKALPEPIISNEDNVPPETETERKLFDIATELLGHDQFGVTSNLISMGMSSLASMRFSARILQILGKNISTKTIMSDPIIRTLAKKIDELTDAAEIKTYDKQEYYPLTESQRGVYVNWELNRNTTQYNIPNMYKYVGIEASRLRDAIETVINAHPILKATMVIRDGDVMMWRRDEQEVTIEVRELTSEFSVQVFKSFMRPFNLLGGDLFHTLICQYGNTSYLCIDLHHTIFDGFSSAILRQEIDRVLDGNLPVGETYSLFDWALDEKKMRESEAYPNAERYFDGLLSGLDATSYPKSSMPDKKGNQQIQQNVHIEALSYCKESGITENCLFMSMFAEVLHRITREDSVLFTTIDYGREDLRLGNAIGMFVKTMPVVSSREGTTSLAVKDAALAIQSQYLNSLQNDIYAFTDMTEKHGFRPEIMFDFQGLSFDDGKTHATMPTEEEKQQILLNVSKVPVGVTVTPLGKDVYQIMVEYDSDLYSEADMQILLDAYSNLCSNAIATEKLSCVSMLSEDMQKESLNLCAGKRIAYDASQTFPSIFMQRASETPDAPAVVDGQGTYSYGELNRLSGALALKLRELGVGSAAVKSPFVSIMLGYQKEFLVASIGVEKACGAYVPLDYDYPNDRLLYMLEDSESQVLITSHIIYNEKTAEGDNFTAKNILFIEDFITEVADGDYADVNYATPDGLAYMIYTSGSTGKPKGVMIPHRAKTNFVNFIAKEWGHTSKSRICCHSSVSFDASIEDLYPVLTIGGTLYIVPEQARKDMNMLHDFIVKNGITGGCYTTQLGQMLLQQYPDLPVDYLVVGGEKMTAAPNCKCRLINTYGPTEFTVDATYFEVEPGREYRNIPIGRPLHNLSAYVVDQYGQLVPQGVAGELCMSGVQMAAGYWKREELTAEKFKDCPFAEGRMYHTGDLVRYNADGQIEYLGRIDSQVKLRGFRIELGEIETLIAGYPGVRMVSVQIREVGGVQHLCAYYSAEAPIDTDELKSYLSVQLTDYMVPTAYMQLDEMPLTPNGKVNAKALPAPEVKTEEIVPPETETEKKLFDIAVELLKHDQFGVTSNLISMGLTSLSAMQLTAFLQQRLEVIIPVTELLGTPVIRAIAAGIDSNKFKSTKKAAIFTKRETPADPPSTEGPASARANPFEKKSNPFVPKKNPFEKK